MGGLAHLSELGLRVGQLHTHVLVYRRQGQLELGLHEDLDAPQKGQRLEQQLQQNLRSPVAIAAPQR
jgi:hypothetical protein